MIMDFMDFQTVAVNYFFFF